MKTEAGFSLLEVMVALVIFGIVSAGMASAFVSHLGYNYDSSLRSDAIAATQIVMENYRTVSPATLPSTGTGAVQIITIDDRDFTVTPQFCANAQFCSAATRHIRLQVSYQGQNIYALETVYTQLK